MDIVRVGIIGIGNIGSAHAMSICKQKIKGMKLTAVCDCKESRLEWAKENLEEHICLFKDYEELIASDFIDAIIIATPHVLHPIIAQKAFTYGLHVLTEKPAGIDTASVRLMNQAAEKSKQVFGIMYNQRTNFLYQTLHQIVQEGSLGQIKRIVWIINNWYRTQAYYDSGDWRATWNGEGGGVLLNQCPHNLDIWQWIFGMPSRIRAFCRTGQYHDINVEDDVTIYGEYESGANVVFITSTGEYPGTNRMEVSGTLGKAVIENGELKLVRLEKDEREICRDSSEGMPQEPTHITVIKQEEQDTGHIGILQNFADSILKGTPLLAPGKEGINGLTISNAAYLSEWTDDWVELPLDEEAFRHYLELMQSQEISLKRNIHSEKLNGEYTKRWNVKW